MALVLYLDASEQITSGDLQSAKTKLTVAKTITEINSSIHTLIQNKLEIIVK